MIERQTTPEERYRIPVRSLEVEVVEGPDAGRRLEASADRVSVGSAKGNDLELTDETVSRFHVELCHLGDGIAVRDLGSTNGVLYGRARIERAVLEAGSVIRLGRTALKLGDGAMLEAEIEEGEALGELLGRASVMRRLMARIRRVAASETSVLVVGETGSGKELIARALHDLGRRAAGPFVTVDCGSLSPTLIASELFGHEKGAFTGADRQHEGAFERAHGGTVFLDEIGELPITLQASLLGALARRRFQRVGGTKPIEVDVRVVSATNRDLREEVNAGRFRSDLFYRLAVVTLQVPPLRERLEDLPLLVARFLEACGATETTDELFPPQAMQRLKEYRWPGNVRELRNFVEATVAMGEPAELVSDGGAAEAVAGQQSFPSVPLSQLMRLSYKQARSLVLGELERIYLADLLERAQGNVAVAARLSGINRTYLFSMLMRVGQR